MNWQLYLDRRRRLIDRALDHYFPAKGRGSTLLWQAIRYGLFSGGKRIRPLLALAAGETVGGNLREILPFACALEMIHTYSLIHDDLPAMDNDEVRRGKPTSHVMFGEGMAILAGDALLTEAFRIMAQAAMTNPYRPKKAVQVLKEVAEAAGMRGMVAGQAADLETEGRHVGVAEVEDIHARKTGALFVVAVRMGGVLAGASSVQLSRLTTYGQHLGLAFQIADDILDAEGDPTGKRSGRQLQKATYLAAAGIGQARERARELAEKGLRALDSFGRKADPLRCITTYAVERAVGQKIPLR